jgi:hypothetical protein
LVPNDAKRAGGRARAADESAGHPSVVLQQ